MKTVVIAIVALWAAYMLGFITAALLAAASRRDDSYRPPVTPARPDTDEWRRYEGNRWPE